MNMKKVIAAALVIGTMTMAGAAFAGPRFHGGHHGRGGFSHISHERWEQNRHGGHNNNGRHVKIDRHHDHRNDRKPGFNGHGGPQRHHRHDVRQWRGQW